VFEDAHPADAMEREPDSPTCWIDTGAECVRVHSSNSTFQIHDQWAEQRAKVSCISKGTSNAGKQVCDPSQPPFGFVLLKAWTTGYLPAAAVLLYLAMKVLRVLLKGLEDLLSTYERLDWENGTIGLGGSMCQQQQDVEACMRSAPWLVRLACPSPGGTLREHGPRLKRNGNVLASGDCNLESAQSQADRHFTDVMDSSTGTAACFYYQCTSQARRPPLPPGSWNRTGTGRLERHERRPLGSQDAALLGEE
jgi:hypothetical protein